MSTEEDQHSKSPSDENLAAAEELELTDEPLDDVEDVTSRNVTISPAKKQLETGLPTSQSPSKSPSTSPGKVKAAAAMFEKGSSSLDRPKPASSGSFRSIPASSSKTSLVPSSSPPTRTQSRTPSITSPSATHLDLPASTKDVEITGEPSTPTQVPKAGTNEAFSEISLSATTPRNATAADKAEARSYALAPMPAASSPRESDVPLPETSKAQKPKASFFTSALGLASSVSAASASTSGIESPKPTRSTSSTSNGSGWRSTVSNILGSRTTTTPSPNPPVVDATSPISSQTTIRSPVSAALRSTSTGFIVNRMDSPVASRDRRISRQDGGEDKLRAGFERVRGEMEDAAREMRKEQHHAEEDDIRQSSSNVDWIFWGAVVQDYEEVARERPRELSRAIQQGIPPVIRGAIWQLMSSSKSTPLEETYKALLKQTSSHEKAIAKDINRTFPNHKFFQEAGGVGQESLFMVVKAFSLYDEDVGYTQGLAFIVAALLLNMPDEEAFCVLVRLMDSYNLRSLFLADMPGLQLRLFQFDRLVEELLPLVHTHFIKKGVKSSMFASQWFMTLFSYRFPLSLVYRVLDIVFAEGIEAIFRFSLALLHQSQDKIVNLEFEQILQFLQTDLFEIYRRKPDEADTKESDNDGKGAADDEEGDWRANGFVRDAYEMKITPFMLDSYEAEYDDMCRAQNKHALELDQLRNANRSLSTQVKQLEASLAAINQEHVELVRQLVMSKIDKEETENELVRYKMLYAELAHAQQDALSTHSRLSGPS